MNKKHYALIDDQLVEDTLMLRRTLGMPTLKRKEPLLKQTEAFGSVLRDRSGQWRMWYCTNVSRDPKVDVVGLDCFQCFALSRDGINWEYPNLGLVEEAGNKNNSIVIGSRQRDANGRYLSGYGGVAGFCVIDNETDPHPHARARFTALYHACPTDTIGGICLAHSDDGVRWTAYEENPVIVGSQDTQNCFFYDRRIGRYVCYERPTIHTGMANHANRKIGRVESADLVHWSVSRVVLDTDERDAPGLDALDEPGMNGPRGRDKQFQGITVFPWQNTYIAFTWFYDVIKATFVNEMLHSNDGIAWKREALREPFIAHGRPADFTGKLLVPISSPPVVVDDEMYLYLSSSPYDHHEIALSEFDTKDERRKALLESNDLFVLSVTRDRFVGYEAGDKVGELLSSPLDWDGNGKLFLNAEIQEGGRITVAFEDAHARPIREFHLDEIPEIVGPVDSTAHHVTFGPGPKTIVKLPTGGPIRLRFFMQNATLYGWTFEG